MAVEMETTTPIVRAEEGSAAASIVDSSDALLGDDVMDLEMESTQRFDEEEEEEESVVETPAIQQKSTENTNTSNTSNETKSPTNESVTAAEGNAFNFVGVSAGAKPFSRAFATVWRVMQALGWQTAQGPGTEFVSMPGTQFFNFRPNINVFDSKGKACWKWLSLAAQSDKDDVESEAIVWDTLWTIAEKQWGWYTMSSGDETWFVKPNTRFEQFQPNVTIFQSKKRAVLQALASQDVRIELGDSVDGNQVISFAPKAPEAEETKPKAKKETASKAKASDMFTTPPPKKTAAASAQSSSKKSVKATPSSGKKASGSKKSTPSKSTGKSPKTSKSSKKKAQEPASETKAEAPLSFHIPEFKCSFGQVYSKLKERGWYYKAGAFEYDYFSPDYTKETAILGGNYFQSVAELESFLKDSNLWTEIESELRDEHAEMVEELRQEAEMKRQASKDRQAAKKSSSASKTKTPRSPAKPKKKPAASASSAAAAAQTTGVKRSSFTSDFLKTPEVKVTIGKVVDKLVKRGWHYKPGRFEYDYFKPNVNVKTATLGEDYFQSETELETYLKTTGLWTEISEELQAEYTAAQERAARGEDSSEEETKPAKKPRVSTPKNDTPASSMTAVAATATAVVTDRREEAQTAAEPLEPAAAKLTNDIWGNSHEFDFEKY